MATGLCTDPRFHAHRAPGEHPERPERLVAIEQALESRGLARRCTRVAARPATRAELERAHAPSLIDRLEDALADGRAGWIDPDTYYGPGSWEAALCAAGAAVDLARAVADGKLSNGAAFVRPPGHHATRDRAMGFCLLNNVAVAAADLRARGLRPAVIDFDVHHGNGTEAIFWDDPEVLYASTHQFPFYPGTGPVDATGGAPARGATVNVPLPAGSGDAALAAAFDQVILPSLRSFRPDVVLLSAGFDAHARDPLAQLRASAGGFARLTARLLESSGGKLVALLEGGYDLEALAESACAMLQVLLGDGAPAADGEEPLAPAEQRAIAAAVRAHRLAAP
jgi:acetoin utilization deacetylase AcuC-like enzyme